MMISIVSITCLFKTGTKSTSEVGSEPIESKYSAVSSIRSTKRATQ
jgi:hypothetical protein